jgi:YidC/Oxa1 family membrane protein insertase
MLDPVSTLLGLGLGAARDFLAPLSGADSGVTWVMAIVLLTLVIRVVLLPLSIKQFRTTLRIQALAPALRALGDASKAKVKALSPEDPLVRTKQAQALQLEQMRQARALRKEGKATFLPVIAPAVLQGVLGIALFHLVRHLVPGSGARFGLSGDEVRSAADASLAGAPLSTNLLASSDAITALGGDPLVGHAVTLVVIVVAVVLSTLALRHSLSRSPAQEVPEAATDVERAVAEAQNSMRTLMPKVMPVLLLFAYVTLPLGLLVSILVVAAWTLVYQRLVWRHHDLSQARSETSASSSD